mmetsp:Transcript_55482/g.126880  ORF Transcript_55482/g.126880 Transcript_55482/m.126880 type:complete len:310 (-) Transcript_55482:125-1054(-)
MSEVPLYLLLPDYRTCLNHWKCSQELGPLIDESRRPVPLVGVGEEQRVPDGRDERRVVAIVEYQMPRIRHQRRLHRDQPVPLHPKRAAAEREVRGQSHRLLNQLGTAPLLVPHPFGGEVEERRELLGSGGAFPRHARHPLFLQRPPGREVVVDVLEQPARLVHKSQRGPIRRRVVRRAEGDEGRDARPRPLLSHNLGDVGARHPASNRVPEEGNLFSREVLFDVGESLLDRLVEEPQRPARGERAGEELWGEDGRHDPQPGEPRQRSRIEGEPPLAEVSLENRVIPGCPELRRAQEHRTQPRHILPCPA